MCGAQRVTDKFKQSGLANAARADHHIKPRIECHIQIRKEATRYPKPRYPHGRHPCGRTAWTQRGATQCGFLSEDFPYWLKRGSAARRGAPRWGPALRALRALRAPHRTPRLNTAKRPKRGSAARRGAPHGPALRALRALRAPHRTPRPNSMKQRPGPVPGRCSQLSLDLRSPALATAGVSACLAAASPSPHVPARLAPHTRGAGFRTGIAAAHLPASPFMVTAQTRVESTSPAQGLRGHPLAGGKALVAGEH